MPLGSDQNGGPRVYAECVEGDERRDGRRKRVKAAVFYQPGDLRVEDMRSPRLGRGEVRVRVEVAVACGTDLKSYVRGHPRLFPNLPARFGHEFVGAVEEVEDEATGVRVGQRVVAGNSAPCYRCKYCLRGRDDLCEGLTFLNGAFAEEINIPKEIVERNLHVISQDIDHLSVASVEPLACVLHALDDAPAWPGMRAVIFGCGAIGCMFMQVLSARGVEVLGVDRSRERVEFASALDGVTVVLAEQGRDSAEWMGADLAVDATGSAGGWTQAVRSLRRGGEAILFGGVAEGSTVELDGVRVHYEQLRVRGVFHHAPRYVSQALAMLLTKRVDGRRLISCEVDLDQLVEGLEEMRSGRAMKVAVRP